MPKILIIGLAKRVKLEMGDEELKSIALTQLVKKLANRLSDGTPESAAFEYLDRDFGEWVDLDDPQAVAGVSCIKIRVKAPQKAAEEVLFSVLCAFLLTHLPCLCAPVCLAGTKANTSKGQVTSSCTKSAAVFFCL